MRLASPGLFTQGSPSPGSSSWSQNESTLVTPNRFLASVAYRQFVTGCLARNRNSWSRPAILSLNGWLTEQWRQARFTTADAPALLSPDQEHVLWRRVIEVEHPDLSRSNSAAAMASRAARSLAEWEIPKADPAWSNHSDAAQFQRWLQRFDRICEREGWMPQSAIWSFLARSQPSKGQRCVFLTHDSPVPALRRLLATLHPHPAVVSTQSSLPPTPCPGTQCDSFEAELDFAARWARATFEARPSRSVAVFVPDLAVHRKLVAQAFRAVFYPGSPRSLLDPTAPAQDLAFSLNAADPLSDQSLVAGALLLLQAARPEIPMADATAILRSRWIAGSLMERYSRAQADLDLRRRRDLDVTLDDLESASARCPRLLTVLGQVKQRLASQPVLDSYAGWVRFFSDLLQAFGWPGDDALTAAETELADTWLAAISRLASLSLVSPAVSLAQALAELRRLLASGHDSANLAAPVQILDSRAAPGLEFDAAFITGLSEQTWPPFDTRSPLIPFELSRARNLPGTTPQLLRDRRLFLTRALFTSAPQLHAAWSGRLSPVAAGFVSQNAASPSVWKGKTAWQSFKPVMLDELEDTVAPPFTADSTARGGTGIIKSQSLCPFRAFAEYRLGARSPEEGCLGLDSRDRGGNLHRVLEFVWRNLQTRDKLLATTPANLGRLVEEACAAALSKGRASSFGKIVSAVEAQRLKEVTLSWLDCERSRKQPFSVETVEGERYFELGGLRLRLRLDRIDRLANGQTLLIDYKSGEQTRNKLKGVRPEEPQLLVYAASMPNEVDGILFAQLKARNVKAVGVTREKQFTSRSVDVEGREWDNFLDEGIANVELLATQFKSGYAAVAPLATACEFCAQKPVCRVAEKRALEMSAEE